MLKLNPIGWVALVLAIVGGLNWGLVGVFNGFDLVAAVFGEMTPISRIIYSLIGLGAIYTLIIVLTTVKIAKPGARHPRTA